VHLPVLLVSTQDIVLIDLMTLPIQQKFLTYFPVLSTGKKSEVVPYSINEHWAQS